MPLICFNLIKVYISLNEKYDISRYKTVRTIEKTNWNLSNNKGTNDIIKRLVAQKYYENYVTTRSCSWFIVVYCYMALFHVQIVWWVHDVIKT